MGSCSGSGIKNLVIFAKAIDSVHLRAGLVLNLLCDTEYDILMKLHTFTNDRLFITGSSKYLYTINSVYVFS